MTAKSLAIAALLVAVVNAVGVLAGGHMGALQAIVDLSAVIVGVIASTLCWWCFAAKRHLGQGAAARWLCLSIAFTVFTLGEIAWAVEELALDVSVPIGSLPDLFWTSGYIFWLIALGSFFTGAVKDNLRWWGVAAGTFLATLYGYTQVIGASDWVAIVQGLYPALDLLMLAFALPVLMVFVREHNHRVLSVLLMCGTIVVWAVYDYFFVQFTSINAYYSGHWIDSIYAFGYALMALSAAVRIRQRD